MRLLHITATHLSLAGGIPVVLKHLVEAQNKINGFSSRVLSINVDTQSIGSNYFDYLGNGSFKEYIDSYKPEVVIFHSHYYFEYLDIYKLLVSRNIPYYIEPHGSFGGNALRKSRLKKIVANNILLCDYMKKAKGYIFLNNSEQVDSKYRKNKELIIPNGIAVEAYAQAEKKECTFYYIGRFDIHHKGLDVLFDALDILEDEHQSFNVVLYGVGNKKENSYVNRRIKKYQDMNVINAGPLYGKLKDEKLNENGIMLLVSRYEGFPMTVLEAWGYGNPCIVTEGTNVAEEVENENLGWRVKLNSEDIANSIIKAKGDYESKRDDYIARVKDYVGKTYRWQLIAERSYKLLNEQK